MHHIAPASSVNKSVFWSDVKTPLALAGQPSAVRPPQGGSGTMNLVAWQLLGVLNSNLGKTESSCSSRAQKVAP